MASNRLASLESEQLVIGSCLCDPSLFEQIAPMLRGEDFYHLRYRTAWQTFERLHERGDPIDLVLVVEELDRTGRLESCNESDLAETITMVTVPSWVTSYVAVIQQFSTRRKMLEAVRVAATKTFDQDIDVADMLADVERTIAQAAQGARPRDAKSMSEIIADYRETFHDGPGPLIEMGVRTLDDHIGGIPRRNFVIIAARPSMGKSGFACHMAVHNAQRGKRVIYMNLETDEQEIMARLASNLGKINSRKIAMKAMGINGEYSQLEEVLDQLESLPIVTDCNSTGELSDVLSRVRWLHNREPADLVIIDHMGLMTAAGMERNRVQEMSTITRAIKHLAREIERPVVALHQLSRAGSGRGDPRPILTDLRDSGTAEQDGDIIGFLYREGYYKKGKDPEHTEFIVAKYRNGPVGEVMMRYDMRHNTFWPLEAKGAPRVKETVYVQQAHEPF